VLEFFLCVRLKKRRFLFRGRASSRYDRCSYSMQVSDLNASSVSHGNFIPQSPATNLKTKEIFRWQQRNNANTNQMNLLSNIECALEQKQPEQAVPNRVDVNVRTHGEPKSNNGPRFLRKGCGTVNQRNKYEVERAKQMERRRLKELGVVQNKPKTQKIVLMEQWREKMKHKDKMLRKKREAGMASTTTTTAVSDNIKLLKQKQKQPTLLATAAKRVSSAQNIVVHTEPKNEQENDSGAHANGGDELKCASQFEVLPSFDDNGGAMECKSVEPVVDNHDVDITNNNQQSHRPKMTHHISASSLKSGFNGGGKGYNFARHSVVSSERRQHHHYPSYSHHHHTSLYGGSGKPRKPSDTSAAAAGESSSNHKYYSETKKLFHKQATVHTASKRDRLAAKALNRKANEPQLNAEKACAIKSQQLHEMMQKYEEKCQEADTMKQSSLEAFRKYQCLIGEKEADLESRQREFEKYKKKQEKQLCQKTQDLDKRSRALLNIPDRKQRTQIEALKQQIDALKEEHEVKEKRNRSKLERLRKQNTRLSQEKSELQTELVKLQKRELQLQTSSSTPPPPSSMMREKTATTAVTTATTTAMKKKKKYCISKMNAVSASHSQFSRSQQHQMRPKTQQTTMQKKATVGYLASTPATRVNRSTNNMYEAFRRSQLQPQTQSASDVRRAGGYTEYVQTSSDDEEDDDEDDDDDEVEDVDDEDEDDDDDGDDDDYSENSTKNGEDEEKRTRTKLARNQNVNNVHNMPANVQRQQAQHTRLMRDNDTDENENEAPIANFLPPVPQEYEPNTMSTQQLSCDAVQHRANAMERMQHPDGKIEHIYADGSRLIVFTNGTEKYIFGNLQNSCELQSSPPHRQMFVKFPNGDVKKILSDATEVYYYAKNNIIHATKPDGMELFFFAGQHEVHFPDDTKHILFADGTKKYIYPNGDEQCVFPPNGNTEMS